MGLPVRIFGDSKHGQWAPDVFAAAKKMLIDFCLFCLQSKQKVVYHLKSTVGQIRESWLGYTKYTKDVKPTQSTEVAVRIKADGNVVAVITGLTVLSCVGKMGPRELAFSALLSFKKLRPTSSDKTD